MFYEERKLRMCGLEHTYKLIQVVILLGFPSKHFVCILLIKKKHTNKWFVSYYYYMSLLLNYCEFIRIKSCFVNFVDLLGVCSI